MSGEDQIRDHATQSYLRLEGDVAEAAAELASSGKEYGVLVGPADRLRLLLTRDGRAAPAVAVDAGEPMDRVQASDIVGILNSGVPGLVVMEGPRVTGVLTQNAIIDYLVEHAPVRSGNLGDWNAHGDAPSKPLTMTCSTCNTVNHPLTFVEGETQCSQGHTLTLAWD